MVGNLWDSEKCRPRCLDHRALARTTAVARPTRDQRSERGRHHLEPLGKILADPVERTAATGAGLLLDVDDLLDPFQMRGQRAVVDLARPDLAERYVMASLATSPRRHRGRDMLKARLGLIGIKLFRVARKSVALESLIAFRRLISPYTLASLRACSRSIARSA